ncbi:bifunctional aspartate transaminase/aspartate 4-decarboxylase [Caballeronia sp. LP006]|jgi:aspartate 4-decarboxylase|uniref:bifunctional aspartate transaminase/aspartate 4-decarboxylase n=1 Tax=unclassified Caballeronia TaxID=2646786 RepID=UPI001FD3DAAE|nr:MULTISPECIES: bifunctional aspartate transaminase/aspartate 4-decarboxylase [unclassified Caballeronia]MDR5775220.1 bifunctional aspartate transaminase/aspartate 4-decarboxylase [Caballeronia sp. LZ002]MDR5800789.1 bifunctional aspartate transaminase/aspartate 4-decarboxylase [Caballeronia sp. LZ001]MDR5828991.1 bifunctional aspartate transaminase/aspartate 4-decarboxylase [Caballeronia sp. LP006]MDR5850658.1 bifunctional aspartate transaminase/aspartate 4-decarboxylase [Caballeronia sp. LZ0
MSKSSKSGSDDQAAMAALSPFELKDELIKAAGGGAVERPANLSMLNAGRGNPNFLATIPRHGFWQLGLFAMRESERSFAYMPEGVGGFPKHEGLEERFEIFARDHKGTPGISFLVGAVSYVRDQLGLNAADFLYEMCEGILASNYPVPDRMLKLSEVIVGQYLRREMIGKHPFVGDFDIFAVEGGTAAMTYIFNTMRENFLIKEGDTIALGTPIFTPYIEIPRLNDYKLNVVNLEATVENGWQYSKQELDKLRDPKVKAFFLVNPSNPPSVKMDAESLEYIAEIVKERPDLILLTDDVYGTFADDFVSLFALCPKNTILVYSYSKYFGATGWRLGTIATHRHNIFDDQLAALPKDQRAILHERYESITTEPDKLKFIDRLVADSRTVALNHTAGLSTPQQVQMVLFSLFSLMDTPDAYKSALKRLIRNRKRALYREIGIALEDEDENQVDYYAILDLEYMGEKSHGREFVDWVLKNTKPSDLLFQLAREARVVLLPGRGFGTQHPSGRVSLANLNESDYMQIGRAIRKLMDSYVERFNKETGKKSK